MGGHSPGSAECRLSEEEASQTPAHSGRHPGAGWTRWRGFACSTAPRLVLLQRPFVTWPAIRSAVSARRALASFCASTRERRRRARCGDALVARAKRKSTPLTRARWSVAAPRTAADRRHRGWRTAACCSPVTDVTDVRRAEAACAPASSAMPGHGGGDGRVLRVGHRQRALFVSPQLNRMFAFDERLRPQQWNERVVPEDYPHYRDALRDYFMQRTDASSASTASGSAPARCAG